LADRRASTAEKSPADWLLVARFPAREPGVLASNVGAGIHLEAAALSLEVKLQILEARTPDEIESRFGSMTSGHASAFYATLDPLFLENRKLIVQFEKKERLPALYDVKPFVEAGGLMSYGPDFADSFRRVAVYLDRILKGAKPGDLPVEQPTKFDLILNLKTAKAIDLTLPPTLLARADEVIE